MSSDALCLRKVESLLSLFPSGSTLQFEFTRKGLKVLLSHQTPWRLTSIGRFVSLDDLSTWDSEAETKFMVGLREEFLCSLEGRVEK